MNAVRDLLLPPRSLSRLRNAEIRPAAFVDGARPGRFRSKKSGFSVEFAGHRQYGAGDDAKHFDWKVYFKTRRSVIRQYAQECNLNAQVILDTSASMLYPCAAASAEWLDAESDSKMLAGARIASLLAWIFTRRRDEVGLTLLTGGASVSEVPPKAAPTQVERVVKSLAGLTPDRSIHLTEALKLVARRQRGRGLSFLISDFADPDPKLPAMLRRIAAAGRALILIHIVHPDERSLPFDGPTRFVGLEDGIEVPSEPQRLRREYQGAFLRYCEELESFAKKAGGEYWAVDPTKDVEHFFQPFLARH